MKKLVMSVVAVLAVSGMAMGASFSLPGVTEVLPGATVEIPISAVGAGALQGVNLYLEVELPLSITAVTFDGPTVFHGNNNGASPYDLLGNMAAASTTTASGSVPVPGVVAIMTVAIPQGTEMKDFFVRTFIPDFGVGSDFVGSAVTTEGQGQGVIRVVPEPATALLLLGALPLIRRRRA